MMHQITKISQAVTIIHITVINIDITGRHSEIANIRQVAILTFAESHLSRPDYFW